MRRCWPSKRGRRCASRHCTAEGRDAGQDVALAELLSEAEEQAELLPLEPDGSPVWVGVVPTIDEVCEDREWPARVRDWRRFWGAVRNWRICLSMDVLDMDLFPSNAELEWLRLLDNKGNLRESRIAQASSHQLAGRLGGLSLPVPHQAGAPQTAWVLTDRRSTRWRRGATSWPRWALSRRKAQSRCRMGRPGCRCQVLRSCRRK